MTIPTGTFSNARHTPSMCFNCGLLDDSTLPEGYMVNAVTILSACVTILRQIVEAMDPAKSRILIDDAVVPGFLGPESLRIFNLLDMYMLGNLNGKERTEKQWRELFQATDERLVIEKIWEEKNGGHQGGRVIELRLKPIEPNGVNGFHQEESDKAVKQNATNGVHQELNGKPAEHNIVTQVHQERLEKLVEDDVVRAKRPEPSIMEQKAN